MKIPIIKPSLFRGSFMTLLLAVTCPLAGQDVLVCDFTGTTPGLFLPWMNTSHLRPETTYSGVGKGPGTTGYGVAKLGNIIDNAVGFAVAGSDGSEGTLATALSKGSYLNVILEATSGTLDLGGKVVQFTIRRYDDHTARQYAIFSSVGGFTEGVQLMETPYHASGDKVPHTYQVPLSSGTFDGLTGPVEFRLYGYKGTYANHRTSLVDFRIVDGGAFRNLTVSSGAGGTAVASPNSSVFVDGTRITVTATASAGYRFAGWTGTIPTQANPLVFDIHDDESVEAHFEPWPGPAMSIAINLNGISDWGRAFEFTDLYKTMRYWVAANADGSGSWDTGLGGLAAMDPSGWPTQVPFDPGGGRPMQLLKTILTAGLPEDGVYTIMMEGAGQINFDIRNDSFGGTRFSKTYNPTGGLLTDSFNGKRGALVGINLYSTSGTDHLRNIRIIRPGFLDIYQTTIYAPPFLSRIEELNPACFRFMDWGATNASSVAAWADRIPPSNSTMTSKGVAYELMVKLANQIHSDMWVCVPHQANDLFVTKLARTLRYGSDGFEPYDEPQADPLHPPLDPALKLYVEYSNETWNSAPAFTQYDYVCEQGVALGLDTDAHQAGMKYTAFRSARIWDIFLAVFAEGTDETGRLVKTIATQSSNPSVTDWRIAALANPDLNPNHTWPDALAIAPYYGRNYGPSNLPPNVPAYPTVDDFVAIAASDIATTVASQVAAQKERARQAGLELICYEGGQHFSGVSGAERDPQLIAAVNGYNRDPRVYDHYRAYLDILRDNGVTMFGQFGFIGAFGTSLTNGWSVIEEYDQPTAQAHKFRALIDWAAAQIPIPKPILSIDRSAIPNLLQFRFQTAQGRSYRLLRNTATPNAGDPGWEEVSGSALSGDGSIKTIEADAPVSGTVFYRLGYQP